MAIDWRGFSLIRQHVETARREFRDDILAEDKYCPIVDAVDNGGPFESPIEAVFVIWFRVLRLIVPSSPNHACRPVPQYEVTVTNGTRYRLDFAVLPADRLIAELGEACGQRMRIAVELDGHDFHEKTKEQVTYRNQRDRALIADGWRVFHFSGSELVKQQAYCAREVFEAAVDQMREIRTAISEGFGVRYSWGA
jgi:hypothetical protein